MRRRTLRRKPPRRIAGLSTLDSRWTGYLQLSLLNLDHGGITVLAAFASPQMSLRRHLETIASLESYARLQVSICASLFFGARSLCGHR